MTHLLDVRYPFTKTLTVKMEADLYKWICASRIADQTVADYVRELILGYFKGRQMANMDRYRKIDWKANDYFSCQITFSIDEFTEGRLKAASGHFKKKVPVIVRAILKDMFYGLPNPYKAYLLNETKASPLDEAYMQIKDQSK